MSTDVNMAKQVIQDKLESQIKMSEANLDTLKALAESAKANVEIKTIAELVTKRHELQQKLRELKNPGGNRWEQAKGDLEAGISDFEKSVKAIESKVKANRQAEVPVCE